VLGVGAEKTRPLPALALYASCLASCSCSRFAVGLGVSRRGRRCGGVGSCRPAGSTMMRRTCSIVEAPLAHMAIAASMRWQ
jgi:hypothetical protein